MINQTLLTIVLILVSVDIVVGSVIMILPEKQKRKRPILKQDPYPPFTMKDLPPGYKIYHNDKYEGGAWAYHWKDEPFGQRVKMYSSQSGAIAAAIYDQKERKNNAILENPANWKEVTE